MFLDTVIYETRSPTNEFRAAQKNICKQVHDSELDKNLDKEIDLYIEHLGSCGIDATGSKFTGPFFPATIPEVIENTRKRDPKKAERYSSAYKQSCANGQARLMHANWQTDAMVKLEPLELGKPPRMVFNTDTEDVVLGRMTSYAFEQYLHESLTIKQTKPEDIGSIFQRVEDTLGDFVMLCLDDTARDGNTKAHDFVRFEKHARFAGVLTRESSDMLNRRGMAARAQFHKFSTKHTSLPSGTDFTSVMNLDTTWFGSWYLMRNLGIHRSDYIILGEGDDCVLCIRRSAWTSISAELITAIGTRLGKVWKIECIGASFDETPAYFVGRHIVKTQGKWYTFPSAKRMFLKSTLVCGSIPWHLLPGRISAKNLSVADKFGRTPIGWAIAKSLTGSTATAIFSREERFSYHGNSTVLEPTMEVRNAYALATSIDVQTQLSLERLIMSGEMDMRNHTPTLYLNLDPGRYNIMANGNRNQRNTGANRTSRKSGPRGRIGNTRSKRVIVKTQTPRIPQFSPTAAALIQYRASLRNPWSSPPITLPHGFHPGVLAGKFYIQIPVLNTDFVEVIIARSYKGITYDYRTSVIGAWTGLNNIVGDGTLAVKTRIVSAGIRVAWAGPAQDVGGITSHAITGTTASITNRSEQITGRTGSMLYQPNDETDLTYIANGALTTLMNFKYSCTVASTMLLEIVMNYDAEPTPLVSHAWNTGRHHITTFKPVVDGGAHTHAVATHPIANQPSAKEHHAHPHHSSNHAEWFKGLGSAAKELGGAIGAVASGAAVAITGGRELYQAAYPALATAVEVAPLLALTL